mgnify:CR=1 FL=1
MRYLGEDLRLPKVRAKNDAFFARTKKFEIDFNPPICQNKTIFIMMSIVNTIF